MAKSSVRARIPTHILLLRKCNGYWRYTLDSLYLVPRSALWEVLIPPSRVESDMFGPPYEYAFIGNSSRGDSKVLIGRAATIEGPFEVLPLNNVDLYALNTGEDKGAFDFRYCVYPHPWAGDLKGKGDLMITWSEGGITGGVLAAMLRLARWA